MTDTVYKIKKSNVKSKAMDIQNKHLANHILILHLFSFTAMENTAVMVPSKK